MKRVACTLLTLAFAASARAEWTKKDYDIEFGQCTATCYKHNPKLHDKCDAYCRCVTDGMQAQFSDHAQLVVQDKTADRIARLQRIANSCNRQIWGSPAGKLKF